MMAKLDVQVMVTKKAAKRKAKRKPVPRKWMSKPAERDQPLDLGDMDLDESSESSMEVGEWASWLPRRRWHRKGWWDMYVNRRLGVEVSPDTLNAHLISKHAPARGAGGKHGDWSGANGPPA